jgi:serine/threonine protein phosphatase PrpC
MYKDEEAEPHNKQVIAVPEVKVIERNATQEFLVLGCDGLWDMKQNEEVVK